MKFFQTICCLIVVGATVLVHAAVNLGNETITPQQAPFILLNENQFKDLWFDVELTASGSNGVPTGTVDLTLIAGPTHGTVLTASSGLLLDGTGGVLEWARYTPNPNFVGSDQFSFVFQYNGDYTQIYNAWTSDTFVQSFEVEPTSATVPEPNLLLMFGSGLASILGFVRQRHC